MRDAMMKSLFNLAENDLDVMLLTGDLGFGVFEEFEKCFPKQFLNIGVAEQNMMGVATGLALEGKKIFTYSIGNFPTLRCLEQIRNDACYHELNINIIASGGGFSYGGLGMSHHATEDLSIMRALPGVTVVAPCTIAEAGEVTKQLASKPGVGYLRIDKSSSPEPEFFSAIKLGKARELRHGNDFTILVTGGIAEEVMAAADELSIQGVNCRVFSIHTLKPIDKETIISICRDSPGIMTVEENNLIGGLKSAVNEIHADAMVFPKRLLHVGLDDQYVEMVGSQKYLREELGISRSDIVDSLLNSLGQ